MIKKILIWMILLSILNFISLGWYISYANYDWLGDMSSTQGVNVPQEEWGSSESALIVRIQEIIEYILWFLFLISFVILLFGGFKMLFAAGDISKFQEWFKILKTTAWALLFIFLAWAIVQLIFSWLASMENWVN